MMSIYDQQMTMIEFRTSETALERERQRLRVTRISVQLMLIGLAIFAGYDNLRPSGFRYGLSFGNAFILLMLAGALILSFVLPRFQKDPLANLASQRVRLQARGIERRTNTGTEHLDYNDIDDLRIHRTSAGEISTLTLSTKRQNMQLDNLEHMDALLEGLRAALPDVPETEKQHRLTMQSNRDLFLVMLASVVGVGLVYWGFTRFNPNQNVSYLLQALVLVIPALFVLFRKPTSNSMQSTKAARRQGFLQLVYGLFFLGLIIWRIFF